MAQIVLMIPKGSSNSLTERRLFQLSGAADILAVADQLPYIPGECLLSGYEGMILLESVEWRTEIAEDMSADARRTTHAPRIEAVKMEHRTDRASATLTKWALTTYVTPQPWEVYFFRGIGEANLLDTLLHQNHFMTMKLYSPLITKFDFEQGDNDGTDNMELSPSAIEWVYHVTDAQQNKIGQKTIRYDVQKGVYSGAEGLVWPSL